VLVSDGAFLELEDCQVSVNGSSAGKSRLPAALRLQEWARGSLENCSFSGAGHGIDLDTESWVEARRCRISANAGWGIWAHHQGGGLVEEELQKLQKELDYNKGFLDSVMVKLNNKRFVENAPPAVLQKEQQKKEDTLTKIRAIEENISMLMKK